MAKKQKIREKMEKVIEAERKSKPHKVVSDLVKGKKKKQKEIILQPDPVDEDYAKYAPVDETPESLRDDAEEIYQAIKDANIGHEAEMKKAAKVAEDLEAKADALEAAEAAGEVADEATEAAEAIEPEPAPKPAPKPTPKAPAPKPVPKPASNPAPKAKVPANCGYTGPKKLYKYWDWKNRVWLIDEDLWVAKQHSGGKWDAIWCWYKDGNFDHFLSTEETQKYLP